MDRSACEANGTSEAAARTAAGTVQTSASLLAELSVSSPRKLFIFLI